MSILEGYKRFKKYLRTGDGYRLCSEWTSASTVEMIDGTTLQETMDNVASDVENTQNSITDVHNELMTSLGGMTFGVDAAGRYGYIKAGADTVTPFKRHANVIRFNPFPSPISINNNGSGIKQISVRSPEKYDFIEGCLGIAFKVNVITDGTTYANTVQLTINNKTISAQAVLSQTGALSTYIFYLNESERPGAGDGYIYAKFPSLVHTAGYPESKGSLSIYDFYIIT